MGILVITVDLDCCRCRAKITKVLDCLKEEFCIEKVEFEDKKEKKVVVVRGKFDAEKLCKKIWCKAGNKVVKEIIIVEVWPPPPPKPPTPAPPKPCAPCCCEHCKPKPDPCCVCENCKPKKPEEKPKAEEKPKTEEKPKPKPQYKIVPYPVPMPPGACQSWPWQCPPHQPCQCCQAPPPPPPPPPACSCSSHGCAGCSPTPPPVWPVWPPQPPGWPAPGGVWPPPWAGCNVEADENSCTVM